MNIFEVRERKPALMRKLLTVWEDSVRVTHFFLSDAEIERIRAYVPEAMGGVSRLFVAERRTGQPIAFMGVEGERLEMLFITSEARGAGLGRRLLEYAVQGCGVRELTVNEQNPQAVGFYWHMGFESYRRTDCDEEGNPYPLVYMRLAQEKS